MAANRKMRSVRFMLGPPCVVVWEPRLRCRFLGDISAPSISVKRTEIKRYAEIQKNRIIVIRYGGRDAADLRRILRFAKKIAPDRTDQERR